MLLRDRRFERITLTDELDPAIFDTIVTETVELLKRRFNLLAIEFNDIEQTNFNPFLLLITAPVYNLFSPFEVAERLQLAKAFHGDDTAFGKFGEDKLLPCLGATQCVEKAGYGASWEPIDVETNIEGHRYLVSIKSGPWTMNQSHANGMSEKFAAIHETSGARIMIGIMYGRYNQLNNKPALVESNLGDPDWFDYLVGKDFWEFMSGVKDFHKHAFKAIRKAQKQFAEEHKDMTFHEHLVSNRLKIAASLRNAFDVVEEEDFWTTLFNNMF